jgi:hypothetical protein
MAKLTERHYMIVSDLKAVRIAKDAIRALMTPEIQEDYKMAMRHLTRAEDRLAKIVEDES